MGTCWRLSPLVAVAAMVLHLSVWSHPEPATATTTTTLSGGLVGTAGAVVAQFFAWMFLLLVITVAWSAISAVIAEVKLRRLYDRADRKWVRLPGYRSARGPHASLPDLGSHAPHPGGRFRRRQPPFGGPGAPL